MAGRGGIAGLLPAGGAAALRSRGIKPGNGGGGGGGMAALGALVKKVWSVRRFVVLLCAPLALVPVLLSLPPKVPGRGGWRAV